MQENGFLGISEKSTKNHRKSTHPKEPGARSGARGGPGGAQAPCGRAPPGPRRGVAWVGPTPPGALLCLVFLLTTRKPPIRSSFRSFPSRSRRHPLFFLGRANLEAELASGEGRSSPSSSSSPLHHPSMTSPSMCE